MLVDFNDFLEVFISIMPINYYVGVLSSAVYVCLVHAAYFTFLFTIV